MIFFINYAYKWAGTGMQAYHLHQMEDTNHILMDPLLLGAAPGGWESAVPLILNAEMQYHKVSSELSFDSNLSLKVCFVWLLKSFLHDYSQSFGPIISILWFLVPLYQRIFRMNHFLFVPRNKLISLPMQWDRSFDYLPPSIHNDDKHNLYFNHIHNPQWMVLLPCQEPRDGKELHKM